MPSTMWLGRKSCPVCSGHWSCPFLRKGLALRNRAAADHDMECPVGALAVWHGQSAVRRGRLKAQRSGLARYLLWLLIYLKLKLDIPCTSAKQR